MKTTYVSWREVESEDVEWIQPAQNNSVTGCCELENETTVTIVATGYNDQIVNPCEIVGFKKSPLLTMQFDKYEYFKLI
jgi:hypothetical protein